MKNKKLVLLLFSIICISMIAFVGCGSSDDSSSEEADSQFPVTVEDNDYFTFEFVECDDIWGDYTFKITNKTDYDFTFDAEKAIVNNETTIDAFIYSDVAAGTSAKDSFFISEEDISDYEDGEVLTLTINYKLIDNDFNDITSGSFDYTFTK